MADSTGINRWTGKALTDRDHVVQSLLVIFTTFFGTRIMRWWFGSNVAPILGRENVTPSTFIRFFSAIGSALVWEPRVSLIQITFLGNQDDLRLGKAAFLLNLQYRPRGHLGDFTPAGARRVTVSLTKTTVGTNVQVLPA